MSDNNIQAFPGEWYSRDSMGDMTIRESHPGMTLRQWYKGMALCGQAAHRECTGEVKSMAEWAGRMADAMLAEDTSHDARSK